MLSIVIEQKSLAKALALPSRVAGAHKSLPLLDNVCLRASPMELTIEATDNVRHVRSRASARVTGSGAVCLDGKHLAAVVDRLPATDVQLEIAANGVELRAAKTKIRLPSFPATDFPPIRGESQGWTPVSAPAFLEALSVRFCALDDTTRPHIAGVNVDVLAGVVSGLATDGHRMGHYERRDVKLGESAQSEVGPVFVHIMALGDVERLASGVETLDVALADGHTFFRAGSTTYVIPRPAEKYPHAIAKGLFDPPSIYRARLTRDALLSAIERAASAHFGRAAVKEGKDGPDDTLKVTFAPGTLTIASHNARAGNAEDVVECDVEGPPEPCSIGVSGHYLRQAAAQQIADEVTVEMINPDLPLRIRSTGREVATMPRHL